jgi:hypothetical protein
LGPLDAWPEGASGRRPKRIIVEAEEAGKREFKVDRADQNSSSTRHPQSSSSSSSTFQSFARDLQYAKEYELAWFLRWALSRITRRKEGTGEICHGIIEWDIYEEWRGRERGE